MPNRSKQKGDRQERAIVELMRSFGLDAYRVPLSGAASGFKSDVELRLANEVLRVESKVRSKGFGNIYRWLEQSHMLVIKADQKQPLAIVPLHTLARLLAQYLAKPVEKATDKTSPNTSLNTVPNYPQSASIPETLGANIEWLAKPDATFPVLRRRATS